MGDYYFIKKYFHYETSAFFFSTFGRVLIYLPPCMDFGPSLPIYRTAWRTSGPMVQVAQAYSAIATGSWRAGPCLGICVRCLSDSHCWAFIWTTRDSSLLSFVFLEAPPQDSNANSWHPAGFLYGADDLVTFFSLSFLNAVIYQFQIASLWRYFSSDSKKNLRGKNAYQH